MPVTSFPSKYPGTCPKCGETYGRGSPIKAYWRYDRESAKPLKVPGKYVHAECPKVYVDPETGEMIHLLQRSLDGSEVPYADAIHKEKPVGAFRVRRAPTKIHPDQGTLVPPEVDKIINPT